MNTDIHPANIIYTTAGRQAFEAELNAVLTKWFPLDEGDPEWSGDDRARIGDALILKAACVMDDHSIDRSYYANTGLVLDPGEQGLWLAFGSVSPHNRTSSSGDEEHEKLAEGILWLLAGVVDRGGPEFAALATAVGQLVASPTWIARVASDAA